jgi:FixJ family two-component response regulator
MLPDMTIEEARQQLAETASQFAAAKTAFDTLTDRRHELWRTAAAAGIPQREIALTCQVRPETVCRFLAKD